jgi:hypothetical protein
MTDSPFFQTQSIASNQSEAITSSSLDDIKALFYLYNAKPDTEIRFLKGGKIVEIADIRSLEEQVADKLGNHNIEDSIDTKIDKFEEYPKFLITKGDQNSTEGFERNNKKLTNEISSRILWILFSVIVSYPIRLLIDHIMFLKN